MNDITLDVESNYDGINHKWNIEKHALDFAGVRTLKVCNSHFCFQTVREYLKKEEIDQMYTEKTVSDFEDKRYNFISTIILPNTSASKINVLFAISSKHRTQSPVDFLQYINQCSEQELINVLNNIVINAYEELYISKKGFFDSFTLEEQIAIQDILTQQAFQSDSVMFMDDLFSKPKFDLIRLR